MPEIFLVALRFALPPLLGAAGAIAATVAPTYYNAVCAGVL